jgi:branched-chain amino acid transport system permease protein
MSQRVSYYIMQHMKAIAITVAVMVFMLLPLVVTSPYYLHVLIMIGINAILAMAFIFVFRTGLLNMSVAAFWAVGAYTSALLVMNLNLSFWWALLLSGIAAGILSLFLGFFLIKTAGWGFVILTSIIGMLAPIFIGNIPALGGYSGILRIPAPNSIDLLFLHISFASKISYYYLILLLTLISILVMYAFYRASTGKAFMAIGLNPNLAGTLGINVFSYRLLAFVVASAIAGLTGCFYAHYIQADLPTAFDMFKTLNIQIYAILGGIDFAFLGPIVGAAVMTAIPEFLRIVKEIELIFSGILVILLILFLPDGILSVFGLKSISKARSKCIDKIEKFAKAKI